MEKEIRDIKKAQTSRKRRAAKLKHDEENEVRFLYALPVSSANPRIIVSLNNIVQQELKSVYNFVFNFFAKYKTKQKIMPQ